MAIVTALRVALLRQGASIRHCIPVRSLGPASFQRSTSRIPTWRAYSTPSASVAAQTSSDDAHTERLLEQSLADREAARALTYFSRLRSPPSQLLSQKLAILLAKRGDRTHTERAVEILRSVYMCASLQPDDYTKLASIYVADACLRHRLLDEALEIHEEAFNVGVTLDLPAYDALVQALVEEDRLDDAGELLKEVSVDNDMSPTERSYYPLVEALVTRQDYQTATSVLELARSRGVQFTSETFHPLVEIAERDDDASDSIMTFLSYVERVWDEVKMLDEFMSGFEGMEADDELDGRDVAPVKLVLEKEDDDDSDEEEKH